MKTVWVIAFVLSFGLFNSAYGYQKYSNTPKPVMTIKKIENKSGKRIGILADVTNMGKWLVGAGTTDVVFSWHHGGGPEPAYFSMHTGNITGSSDFAILSDGCNGATLTPGGAPCDVVVRFTPTTLGFQIANYIIGFTGHRTDSSTYGGTVAHGFNAMIIEEPPAQDPNPPPPKCQNSKTQGSIIRSDSQSLSEFVQITGTPFQMFYTSEYAQSYVANYNTVNRKAYFNPEGWILSVHHYFDINQMRLFKGTGTSEVRDFTMPASGTIQVVNGAGSEVYVFDMDGKHLQTLFGLTGAIKYAFTYSTSGKLTSVVDAHGNTTTFTRTGSGALDYITAPFGQITNVSVNGSGLISAIQNPKGETYSFTYKSGTDLLETYTKPGGQVSTFSYNANGRLTQDVGNGGNSWSFLESLLTTSRKLTKTSNLGRTTEYHAWAEYGDQYSSEVEPSGFETENGESDLWRYSWNSLVEHGTQSDVDERFGVLNRRITSSYVLINGQNSTTDYTKSVVNTSTTPDFFNFSTITETATTSGRTSTTVFNNSTKTYTTTSDEGAVSSLQINSAEKPVGSQVGSDTPWTYSYNSNGQLVTATQGTHNTVTNTYNSLGQIQKVTNVRSEETSYVYDLAGRVTQEVRPDGKVVAFSYDSNGKLVGVTPPSRPEHIFGFNSMELMSSYEPPALTGLTTKDTLYSYNLDKQLTNILRPDGQSAAYTYNSTTGLLSQVAVTRGNYSFQYQTNTDLVNQAVSPDNIKSNYTYYGTTQNSEEQTRNSDGYLFAKVSFGFDSDHRVISRTIRGHSPSPSSTINITYNDDDKPTQIGSLQMAYTYPSGRLSTTNIDNISDQRTYDAYGNLASYTATYNPTSGSPQVLYTYTLTRDLGGRIIGKSETVLGVTDVYAYTYDVVGRLKTVTKNGAAYSNYNYDDNGNRISGMGAGQNFTATYDNQDRLLTLNTQVFTYNANGDLTLVQWPPAQQSSYAWDAMGNMISAVSTGGSNLEYKYDAKNRWVQTIYNGTTLHRRIYENDYRIAAQYSDTGTNLKEFVYATNVNSPDYMISGGVKYRLIKDHLGSPRLTVKTTDGSVAQRINYTDLGRVVTNTSPYLHPFGFAGGIIEHYTRLVKFGARFYDTDTGRWTTKDPIRFDGGDTNLYGYVLQDPVNLIDPEGKNPLVTIPVVVIGGLIVGNEVSDYINDPFYGIQREAWLNDVLDWMGLRKKNENECPPKSAPPENMPKPPRKGMPPISRPPTTHG